MADGAIFAGPTIRRIRRREDITQATMAQRLDISPSYLNLIERNRRPLSARLLIQLAEEFDFDPRALNHEEVTGGIDGMLRRLSDERFSDLDIDRADIDEWLAAAPQGAMAFARLFDAQSSSGGGGAPSITQQVRDEIERWKNHFGELDDAAEELADELRMSSGDAAQAIAERLQAKHQISVRVLPAEVLPDTLRRLDLHARQLQLSELLAAPSRTFHMALQLGLLEKRDTIREYAQGARLEDPSARQLFERHLQGYFAAALLMPYGRFLRACEASGYDVPVLQRRFGVSFEQAAHRLTTLQRVGQRGLPFFMARIDRAGQFSKRFSGASGTTLLEGMRSCPLWVVHEAFERAGRICAQTVSLEASGGSKTAWFTFAQSVDVTGSRIDAPGRFAVLLGLEARLATTLAQAKGHLLSDSEAVQIGLGCARCFKPDCAQRSLPPRGAALDLDERQRGLAPLRFARR